MASILLASYLISSAYFKDRALDVEVYLDLEVDVDLEPFSQSFSSLSYLLFFSAFLDSDMF